MVLFMRTYDETYERIMAKKVVEEKEIKLRNKKLFTSVTTISCLCICLATMFAMSKARIGVNLNEKEMSDVYNHIDTKSDNAVNNNTISTTFAENPGTQASGKQHEDITDTSGTNSSDTVTDLPVEQDGSTTLLAPQVITTNVHGGEELPDWKKEEIEKHRISMVRSAMRAVAEDDVDKINIDKSYIISLHGKPGLEEQGNEYYLMHLEGDDFYYEVEIDAGGQKAYSAKRIDK